MFDVEKVGQILQQKMHLMDWNIHFKVVDKKAMKKVTKLNGYAGFCEIQKDRTEAFVWLNSELDCNKTDNGMYFSLAHELTHIVCWVYVHFVDEVYPDCGSDHSSYRVDVEEKMINALTRIFVESNPLEMCIQ